MNVSIAISAYNSSKLLDACLAGLLRQKAIHSIEVIVIDSGSLEDEFTVCQAYKEKFVRFIYERTDRETLYSAWNRALAKASGKYFMNANTDDALHPNALQMLADALESRPDAALAYGDWMWATVPNATFPWDPCFRRCVHSEYHPSLPLFYAYAGCHQFWRADKLRELGGFNANYKAAGDYDALCRMALKRWHAVYIPEAVSAFYQNPQGLSRSSSESSIEAGTIKDNIRNQLSIADIYSIDPNDEIACLNSYVDLAERAINLHIPWSEHSTPDREFAKSCLLSALAIRPNYPKAKALLRSIYPNPPSKFARLRAELKIILSSYIQKWSLAKHKRPSENIS